jgi:Predicted metal-dependent hydrolase of the TIM-barrel fold
VIQGEFFVPMSAGYIPFHPNPSKPKYKPPAGAVDAHCHVFGPEAKFPFAPKRKYTPCDAPKETLWQRRDFLGFDKNVIVQATCHDTDNRALVDALVTSNNKAKGVAFVGEDITDAGLKELDDAGVKGVRFNFIKRLVDSTPKDVMQRIAARIAKLGWHRGLFRARRSRRDGPVPEVAADHAGVRSHGVPGRESGRQRQALPELAEGARHQQDLDHQGHLPGALHLDRPALRRRGAVRARHRRALSRSRDLGHRLAASEHAKGGAGRGVLVDMIPKIAPTAELQKKLLVDNPMKLYWA